MILSRDLLTQIPPGGEPLILPMEGSLSYPERVLQFGTGVLLRGLVDYCLDQANRQGGFRGLAALVKSTSGGPGASLAGQDHLYTLCIRGGTRDSLICENILVSSISRIMTASAQWDQVLVLARSPELEFIISNTTEIGLEPDEQDDPLALPPRSFPGKLTAFLYHRFLGLDQGIDPGLIILPAELVENNGSLLRSRVVSLAQSHGLGDPFLDWLGNKTVFCNTLVDRIVPGALPPDEKQEMEQGLGYEDPWMILAEPYYLWAIESPDDRTDRRLSFAAANPGIVLTRDIRKYRELKLRLLNGTHTILCGLALLAGYRTVLDAMEDAPMAAFIRDLMIGEISPAITEESLSLQEAESYVRTVLDRFSNPFLAHQWISITLQYSSKMIRRDLPILEQYFQRYDRVPRRMALGMAAFLLFMKCERNPTGGFEVRISGQPYPVQDIHAPYFAGQWERYGAPAITGAVLGDRSFWGLDQLAWPGWEQAVGRWLSLLLEGEPRRLIREYQNIS